MLAGGGMIEYWSPLYNRFVFHIILILLVLLILPILFILFVLLILNRGEYFYLRHTSGLRLGVSAKALAKF